MEKNIWYRRIPKVDALLEDITIKALIAEFGRESVMEGIRTQLEDLRKYIATADDEDSIAEQIACLVESIEDFVEDMYRPNMRNVYNGTGTILHTNLGRAPIGKKHMEHIFEIATGYSNLEYNLTAGRRGERYSHFEKLLCKITGAEAAMAVNNNAAAVMLVLGSLAKGGEVIVSRGELVEIGGKFRIPDVMERSGATLVEVGTTNKTHFEDYAKAITEDTSALLKVHTSNYRIVGFTETVDVKNLSELGAEHDIPVIEDLGSGVLIDLSKYGITYEPTVQESIANGADVVCFSGDKLLGGPQAGIIVGKKKYIDLMKKNQLTRALRIDKFTAAALELVLMEYQSEEQAVKNIPTLSMLTRTEDDLLSDANQLLALFENEKFAASMKVVPCESQIGGGSLPLEMLPSYALKIIPEKISVSKLEENCRNLPVPLIGRCVNDAMILDVRTLRGDWKTLVEELREQDVFSE